jgi:hypothetical protein
VRCQTACCAVMSATALFDDSRQQQLTAKLAAKALRRAPACFNHGRRQAPPNRKVLGCMPSLFCPRGWSSGHMAFLSLLHPRFCFPTTSLTNPAASVDRERFGDWPDACVMQRGPPGAEEMATIGPLTSAAAAAPLPPPPQLSFWEDDLQVLSANVVLLSLP